MYPFYVLDLPEDADDLLVEQRYRQLTRNYPPDEFPEIFATIRAAYEALNSEEKRLETRLNYFDKTGSALTENFYNHPLMVSRRRLSRKDMLALSCICSEL